MSGPDQLVAVVGAGPVGQTAALLLARYGVSSVLLDERENRDVVGSRSICQQREALDTWAYAGVGEQIAAEGLTWARARTFHREAELFCFDLDQGSGWSPFPPFVNLSQSRTEEILDSRIAGSPLIETRWGHRVTGVNAGGTVSTSAGEVRASYVVLACGSRADDLRGRLGVTFDGHSFDDRFLICDIRTDLGDWAEERRFYFDPRWNPGRQVLIHPCPDSTYRIDWQVPADYEPATDDLDRRIRAIIGDRPYEVVWRSVYRFHSRVASRLQVGRVLLAGDCAHVYSPFGARGLNSGVADADNLAWKLAYVLRGWAGPELIASYHDERHAAALENLDVTSATMRFLIPPDDAARQHRLEVLERATHDPAAWRSVDSGRLAEAFWYDTSPLITPSSRHPGRGRPPRGQLPAPGPGTLLPDAPITVDGTPTRLRTLARGAILALTGPSVDVAAVDRTLRSITSAPTRTLAMPAEPATTLNAAPDDIWLIRPDAYISAVVTDPGPPLATAIHRLLP